MLLTTTPNSSLIDFKLSPKLTNPPLKCLWWCGLHSSPIQPQQTTNPTTQRSKRKNLPLPKLPPWDYL